MSVKSLGTQISPPQPPSACWVVGIRHHHSRFRAHFLQPLIKVITFKNQQQERAFQWVMFGLVWNSWPAGPRSWGDLQTARSAASCVGWGCQQTVSTPSLKYTAIFLLSTDNKADEEQRDSEEPDPVMTYRKDAASLMRSFFLLRSSPKTPIFYISRCPESTSTQDIVQMLLSLYECLSLTPTAPPPFFFRWRRRIACNYKILLWICRHSFNFFLLLSKRTEPISH